MDKNEIKLPDSLKNLIEKEKRKGIAKFENSDFEKKIYNRIRDQRGGLKVSFKLILIPASLVLILISSLFVYRGSRKDISVKDKFQIVLETVTYRSTYPQNISQELKKEREKFEVLQNRILASVKNSKIGVNNLSEHISSSLLSASDENELELRFPEEYNREDFMQIKEDISYMNKKDDYSELFSRIIDKLTEG